jgi:outer membrane immunogenic protein
MLAVRQSRTIRTLRNEQKAAGNVKCQMPQTMVYVTGGGAWAKIDTSEFLPGQFATTSAHQESNTRSGWTVGGGLEYAVGYGWSVKSEFLYVKFDDYTTFTNAPFAVSPAGNISPRTVKLEDYIWRAGLNYKFW